MQTDSRAAAAGAEVQIVSKIWGHEEWLVNQALEVAPAGSAAEGSAIPTGYCLKRLAIKPRAQCSLHRHQVKDETFIVEQGTIHFELEDEVFLLTPGEKLRIPTGSWHRFTNRDHTQVAFILEISTFHVDEDSYRRTVSRLLGDAE